MCYKQRTWRALMCRELLYSINTLTPSSTAFDFCSIHEERNITFPEPLKKKKWFWWLADWSRVNTEIFWGQGQKSWRPAFANQASSALLSFFGESNHITCLPLTCTGLRQSRSNLEPFHVWQCWTIRTPAQETITAPLVRHRVEVRPSTLFQRLMATVILTIPWQPNA